MAKANFIMWMEIYSKENGPAIRLMVMESIYMSMVRNMRVIGKMICNMAQVLKLGVMEVNMREIMLMAKKKAMEYMFGLISNYFIISKIFAKINFKIFVIINNVLNLIQIYININNRSKYDGEWDNNKICGKGTYIWADGRKYEGDWLNNNMHGKGIYSWKVILHLKKILFRKFNF